MVKANELRVAPGARNAHIRSLVTENASRLDVPTDKWVEYVHLAYDCRRPTDIRIGRLNRTHGDEARDVSEALIFGAVRTVNSSIAEKKRCQIPIPAIGYSEGRLQSRR
jgi:hypothetical protein